METLSPNINISDSKQSVREEWFDNLIHNITTDKRIVSSEMASKDTQRMYDGFIFGEKEFALNEMRNLTSKFFVSKLVIDYSKLISEINIKPIKLLITHNDAEVLVWAEISDDDEFTEISLFKIEAKINAKYFENGFNLSSTIVEKSDNIITPPHYKDLTSLTIA